MGIVIILKRYRNKNEANNLSKVPLSKIKGTILNQSHVTHSRAVFQ